MSVVVLLVAAYGVAASGGFRWEPFGLRLSMTSPSRAVLLAGFLVLVRRWRAPGAPLHRWLARPLARLRQPSIPDTESSILNSQFSILNSPSPLRTWRGEWLWVPALFLALTALMTWQQLASPYSVGDTGDPLFSIWRLSWVAHQLPRDPLRLFDANIFYPELRTLAYSDAMLATALMAAPLLWLGVHQVLVYNIVLVLSFAASGVAMYALVRTLTGDRAAAFVAGVAFAFYPFRFEHYSHLELQVTFWMPLALLMMHRTMTTGRARDGAVTGLLVALQTLVVALLRTVPAGRHGGGVAGDWRTRGGRGRRARAVGGGGRRPRRAGAPGCRALPPEPGTAGRAAGLGGADLQRDAAAATWWRTSAAGSTAACSTARERRKPASSPASPSSRSRWPEPGPGCRGAGPPTCWPRWWRSTARSACNGIVFPDAARLRSCRSAASACRRGSASWSGCRCRCWQATAFNGFASRHGCEGGRLGAVLPAACAAVLLVENVPNLELTEVPARPPLIYDYFAGAPPSVLVDLPFPEKPRSGRRATRASSTTRRSTGRRCSPAPAATSPSRSGRPSGRCGAFRRRTR